MSGVFSLGEVVRPNRPRVKPESMPNAPFIGMEHVEAHTMKLLGTVPAATMKSSAVHFKPGDVLYGRLRPYLNKVFRPTFEGLCSAEFIVFPENERIDGRYLQYFLNSGSFVRFATHLNAGDRPRVDFDQIAPYPIPVPTLERQHEIVAELEKQFSRLDEAVANLQRVKANLKRYKASVLKAAVEGRLVETEASLAHREGRTYETGEQLLQRILEARRAKWSGRGKYKEPTPIPSESLADLPEGWAWVTTDHITHLVTSGSRGWGDFYADEGVLFIRAQDIKTDELNRTDIARVNISVDAEGTRSSVSKGDILVTITGANVTKSALVPELGEIAFVSQHVALLKLCLPVTASFVFSWIVSPANGRKTLEKWAYGAGKPGLNLEQVRALPIALPPFGEQQRIVAELDRQLSILHDVEAEVDSNLRRAQALRGAVLSKSFCTD